jgi:hypothetical protein
MGRGEIKEFIDKEYEENNCLVAYLDILGFREHLERYINPKQAADAQILEKIEAGLDDAFKSIKTGINEYFDLIRYRNFSDCSCISAPEFCNTLPEASALSLFLTFLNSYNFHLIRRNIYLRGGVSSGFHHEEENLIFSEGLIKAFDLESKKAVYPRIIIDKELVKRLKRLWKTDKKVLLDFGIDKKILTDWNGTAFINPFNAMKSVARFTLDKEKEEFKSKTAFEKEMRRIDKGYYRGIKKNVENKIAEYKNDDHILQKYLWLNELLRWNMNQKQTRIKFEYLLK